MSGVRGQGRPSRGRMSARTMLAVCATLSGGASSAESVRCDLDGLPLAFVLDRTQFVDAYAPGEPDRRKVTQVALGDAHFEAEPFVLGGALGFHEATRMFVLEDGHGRLIEMATGAERSGECRVD